MRRTDSRVHFARNLLALIPCSHKDMVAALFRTIFAQPDRGAVFAAWEEVRDQLVETFPKVGPLMDAAKTEVLAFTAFPKAHWIKIWSNNRCARRRCVIVRRWKGSAFGSSPRPDEAGAPELGRCRVRSEPPRQRRDA